MPKRILLAALVTCGLQPTDAGTGLPSDAQIRSMLKVVDQLGGEQQILIDLGAKLFPAYTRILHSADVTPTETTRIFNAIAAVKGDRSQFLEDAVAGLAHPSDHVRRSAVALLAHVGSSRESAPIAVLLSDADATIAYAAAKTLSVLGDRRTLAALDVWIASGSHRNHRELRAWVGRCREELRSRLERTEPPKK